MILLAHNCLVFQTESGESIPYSSDNISVEILGEAAGMFDPEFIKHAAAAVFHYYRDELGRNTVSVAEFSLSLEKVLRGFKLTARESPIEEKTPRVIRTDLRLFAPRSDANCELLFFPRLRDELQKLLREGAQTLCFQGLRPCVKQLSGAQRWTRRCQELHDQIVEFLRCCMSHQSPAATCALVVK
jgi:hypothetical protein